MLFSRLAKASTGHNLAPSTTNHTNSGSKRATLSVFSQLRQVEDFSEDYRATEDDINDLDQDLFREIAENSPSIPFKQVSITPHYLCKYLTRHLCLL